MHFQGCGLQLLRWLLLALHQELVGQDGRSMERWDHSLHGSTGRDTTMESSRSIQRADVPSDQPALLTRGRSHVARMVAADKHRAGGPFHRLHELSFCPLQVEANASQRA